MYIFMFILVQMMKTRESYDREWRIWEGVGWVKDGWGHRQIQSMYIWTLHDYVYTFK